MRVDKQWFEDSIGLFVLLMPISRERPHIRRKPHVEVPHHLGVESLETREVPTVYPVNVLVDAPANLNDEPETLRDAITRAN
ncbi:MAG: hypothetical protein L0241_13480, partial [Planctomycetia bacterium]|nr:hypothetical protein [Planctomycetia bacterium]